MAPVGLHRLQVRPINYAAQIDVVAKVAGSDRLASVGLKLLLVSPLGAAGIVCATDIAYVATVLHFYLWFIRRWLARADWA